MKTGYKAKKWLIPGAAALFLGGMIYILFRPSEPLFFSWLRSLGLQNILHAARERSLPLYPKLSGWLVYSFPDGLWAFAYAWAITEIWYTSPSGMKYFWMATIPLIAPGVELLQLPGIITGTFSFQDMLWELSGVILGISISIIHQKHSRHEKIYFKT